MPPEVVFFRKNFTSGDHATFQIAENAERCRRPPGKPRMVLELGFPAAAAASAAGRGGGGRGAGEDVHDNREINRRNAAAKTKIFVKIFFNGKAVCQTASKSLLSNRDFLIHIGQIFPLQIMQLPETLKLQVIDIRNGNHSFILINDRYYSGNYYMHLCSVAIL